MTSIARAAARLPKISHEERIEALHEAWVDSEVTMAEVDRFIIPYATPMQLLADDDYRFELAQLLRTKAPTWRAREHLEALVGLADGGGPHTHEARKAALDLAVADRRLTSDEMDALILPYASPSQLDADPEYFHQLVRAIWNPESHVQRDEGAECKLRCVFAVNSLEFPHDGEVHRLRYGLEGDFAVRAVGALGGRAVLDVRDLLGAGVREQLLKRGWRETTTPADRSDHAESFAVTSEDSTVVEMVRLDPVQNRIVLTVEDSDARRGERFVATPRGVLVEHTPYEIWGAKSLEAAA